MNITNDLVTEYIQGYYRPLTRELAELREIGERDRVPIILKETEMVLDLLLSLKKPRRILEIGTAIGYSSLYFALKCPDAEIYTIEKDEIAVYAARANIDAFGMEKRIHSLLGDGQEQTQKLADSGICGFDFVFIDAAKSHYRRFLDAALDVCSDGALIVSDNILQKAMTVSDSYDPQNRHKTNIRKMREYVDCITCSRELQTSLMSVGDGLAVSIYRGENG
ncbi:MAG: O-methyltransferase [Emergencia sp.]